MGELQDIGELVFEHSSEEAGEVVRGLGELPNELIGGDFKVVLGLVSTLYVSGVILGRRISNPNENNSKLQGINSPTHQYGTLNSGC